MKKLVSIITTAIILSSCETIIQSETIPEKVLNDRFAENIKTVKAQLCNHTTELTFTGRVVSNPDQTISYSPLVNGVIVKSYFSLGDRVQKGQPMLDIRSAELSSLQSELTIARRNLKSIESLHLGGMATERELVEAHSTVEKLEADFVLYGQNKGSGVFSITAPGSGYVIEKRGVAGSTVASDSEPLFSIADLSTVWVVANVFAANLNAVQQGQNVEITSAAYPKEIFKGKINSISQVFDPEDKTIKARIILKNKDLKLKPDMSVAVKLIDQTKTQLVAVPDDAVIFDKNTYFVVVDTGNKNFEIREIVTLDHHNGSTYICDGLKEGEQVVTKNQLLIYNQLKGK